jgi:SEC-C motif
MGSEISRNEACPCGSGRKFKRCCKDALDKPAGLAEQHNEVGSRIQAWADQHHRQQMQAGLEEILGGYEDIVVGDADLQLVGTWLLSDRELPVGGTIAERYAGREDISREERDIAQRIVNARITLLKVKGATPGRSISVHDIGRDEYVTVFSHGVSKSVKSGDVIVRGGPDHGWTARALTLGTRGVHRSSLRSRAPGVAHDADPIAGPSGRARQFGYSAARRLSRNHRARLAGLASSAARPAGRVSVGVRLQQSNRERIGLDNTPSGWRFLPRHGRVARSHAREPTDRA